jgi:hypothetical protein
MTATDSMTVVLCRLLYRRAPRCEDVSTIVLLDQLQAETCGGRGQQVRRVNTRV